MSTILVQVGILLAGLLITALFTPKPKDSYGSRLSDINVTPVSPGNVIPRVWGTMKIPCQVIFSSPLIETMHTHQASKKSGKGSLLGQVATSYTYTYSLDVAFGVCGGPVLEIQRIWANQKLIFVSATQVATQQADFDAAYQSEATRLIDQEGVALDMAAASAFVFAFNNFNTGEVVLTSPTDAVNYISAHPIDDTAGITGLILYPCGNPVNSTDTAAVNNIVAQMYSGLNNQLEYISYINRYDLLEIYYGDENQIPNSLMEGYLGSGNAPAFRACCYFVIQNLQLMDFGNSLPAMTACVQMNSNGTTTLTEILTDLCLEAGLTAEQFDAVSHVSQTPISGFCVTANTSARQVMQDLQTAFSIDASESGGIIVFSMVNKNANQIIDRNDFGAHVDTEALPTSVEITRISDYDLPYRLNFNYQEPARNYSKNMVYFQRSNTPSLSVENLEVTAAMDRSDAQAQVINLLAQRMFAKRIYKIMLPRKYIGLDASDVIKVLSPGSNSYYEEYYCTEVQVGANGVIQASFIDHFHLDPRIDLSQQVAIDSPVIISDRGVAVAQAQGQLTQDQNILTKAQDQLAQQTQGSNNQTIINSINTQITALEAQIVALETTVANSTGNALISAQEALSLAQASLSAAQAALLQAEANQAAYTTLQNAVNAAAAKVLADELALTKAVAANTATQPSTSSTMAFLFDCPFLLDTDPDKMGFSLILCGAFGGWQGGGLYVDTAVASIATAYGLTTTSTASGSNWLQVAMSAVNVPYGIALDALVPNMVSCYWDYQSVIHVFINNQMSLQSADMTDMLTQPLNVTFIGSELVQYANATDLGNGLWRLDTFLRGIRNTEMFINNHVKGENFVRLTTGMSRVTTGFTDVNVPNTFVPMSIGANSESQSTFSFTNTGNCLKNPTPLITRKFRDVDDGHIEVDWFPRVRQNGQWKDGSDVVIAPNDLPESYNITIYASDLTTIKNIYSIGGALGGSFVYTVAQQTADYGAAQNPVYLTVNQQSSIIGSGNPIGVTV